MSAQPITTPLAGQPTPSQDKDKVHYDNLLEVLVDQGRLAQEQAIELLSKSVNQDKTVEAVIRESGLVSEDDITQAKATFYNIPYVNLAEVGVFPEALSFISEGVARRYGVLPFSYDKANKTLLVAMKNPLDVPTINFLEQKTSLKIKPYFASESEIERLTAEHYSQNLSTEVDAALKQTNDYKPNKLNQKTLADLSGGTIRQAPINKIVQTILTFAIKSRASDIHIEPLEDRTRVRYRIDGILYEKLILPKSVHDAVVSRIKILADLKIDEKRLPQDGRFDFSDGEHEIDLRVSTLPTVNGEKVVMRLLPKNAKVPTLEELGLDGLSLKWVKEAIRVPHGIILITGPTGSGKTTTLYSILHTINTPKVNIMTLEDPVEYQMSGVNQVQINPQAGLTFASGLRSFLRQDPNIIMVGEIRDSETASLAVQAALTGHLVFSTLHTSSAAGAIPRLIDMGTEPFLLASSMELVIAQRIARRINPKYKESYKPPKAVIEDIKQVLGRHFEAFLKENNLEEDQVVLYRASKDRPEVEPEYKGRIAIFEVMRMDEEIDKMIMESKPAEEIEKVALRKGMLLMKQDGYLKALRGITTIEEVLRVAEI